MLFLWNNFEHESLFWYSILIGNFGVFFPTTSEHLFFNESFPRSSSNESETHFVFKSQHLTLSVQRRRKLPIDKVSYCFNPQNNSKWNRNETEVKICGNILSWSLSFIYIKLILLSFWFLFLTQTKQKHPLNWSMSKTNRRTSKKLIFFCGRSIYTWCLVFRLISDE